MRKRIILVVAAHPDDEVIGCGATIARHSMSGDEVHVVILAEGVTSRDKIRDRNNSNYELSELAKVARVANEILGVHLLTLHDLPDNRLDSVDLLDLVKLIEDYIQTLKPDILYTHHAGDVNIDHRLIHEAVITATRPQPGQSVKTLLFFEIQSSTEWQPPGSAPIFSPNWFVDVSLTLQIKMKALAAYKSEMRPFPHPRSSEAVAHLARWRGATVGHNAAEAFMLGRQIVSEPGQ